MSFVFLDTETSSLDPYNGDITECGCVYIDDKCNADLKNVFHKRFKLQNPANADEEALAIGHYSESIWEKSAVSADTGLLELNEWLKGVSPSNKPIMVATNAEFDKSFLFSHADRFHVYLYVSPTWIDLISLWLIFKYKNNLNHLSNGQEQIAKHFNITNPKAHMAITDAATGALCFSKMMKAISFTF